MRFEQDEEVFNPMPLGEKITCYAMLAVGVGVLATVTYFVMATIYWVAN